MNFIKNYILSDYSIILQGLVILIILLFLSGRVVSSVKKDTITYLQSMSVKGKGVVNVYKNVREIVIEGSNVGQNSQSFVFPKSRWVTIKAKKDVTTDEEQILIIELK